MCGANPTPPPPPQTIPIITTPFSATKAVPFPPTISYGTNTSLTKIEGQNLITFVRSVDIVVFQKGGNIKGITGFYETKRTNLFRDESWRGVIVTSPPGGLEFYSIPNTVNAVTYYEDPKVAVNS